MRARLTAGGKMFTFDAADLCEIFGQLTDADLAHLVAERDRSLQDAVDRSHEPSRPAHVSPSSWDYMAPEERERQAKRARR